MRQVEAEVVAHSEELGKGHPLIVRGEPPGHHAVCEAGRAGFIVRATDNVEVIQSIECQIDGGIEVAVRGALVGLNGGGTTFFCSPLPFLFHVRPPHEFDPGDPPFGPRLGFQRPHVVEAIVAIELCSGEDNAAAVVVSAHHGLGQAIDGALQPRLLGIDQDADVPGGGGFAESGDPVFHALPSGSPLCRHGTALSSLFEEVIVRQGADLEDGKGEAGIALCRLDGGEDFIAGCIQCPFAGLSFGAEIEDGLDPKLMQALGSGEAVFDVFSSAEVVKDWAKGPSQREPQGDGELKEAGAEADQPRGSDEAEHPAGPTQLGRAAVGEGHFRVIEPHG